MDTMSNTAFNADLLKNLAPLRAFAISLAGNVERADDLVQETFLKALANRTGFAEGTNLRAWLFTILRNEFYSYVRKRRREVEDAEGRIASSVAVAPSQMGSIEFQDMQAALALLPAVQREALLLVGASNMSYEEAANICGVAVGTIKSRTSRARARLAELMGISGTSEIGADPTIRAALSPH